jgi:hypothetical protein
VVAVIALGVGTNTALFSVLNATLFRPLPVDRPEELVALFTIDGRNPAGSRTRISTSRTIGIAVRTLPA